MPKTLLEARRRAAHIAADPISAKDIRRLTGLDLDEFYARLAREGGRSGRGRHTTTRHHYHALIRAALNQLEQRKRAEARCDVLGIELADEGFVWSQRADHQEPWRPDRVSGAFTDLRNREHMPSVCLNDLRHFSATQLVAASIDPCLVASRFGLDASVVLRIYSHVLPARDQAAAETLPAS